MKWITTTVAVLALATNSCAEGQDVINFVLDQEGANGIRGQQQPIKPSRYSKTAENEEVLVDTLTLSLLPEKMLIEKPEVLSNDKDKESIASVDPQFQTVLVSSMPQDVDDLEDQAQGRRLDALQGFIARCESTSGLLGSDAYVDCVGGVVEGTTTDETCADACIVNGVSKCCTGDHACGSTGFIYPDGTLFGGFTGKGEQSPFIYLLDLSRT